MSELGFRIEASSKAFEILANNLYKDKTLAVIRELCCNAYDAQVEAGNETTPFEVHLPTRFETYFSVRDFGNGLSSDQIEEIFTVFFASTKTGSSAFTGSFGLGAKTPFAIVNEFYVNSYQNKTLTKYVCKRKTDSQSLNALAFNQQKHQMAWKLNSISRQKILVNQIGKTKHNLYSMHSELHQNVILHCG